MYLLDPQKPMYKAALHFHSDCSDGKPTVEEWKTALKEHGYAIAAYTDHEHLLDHSELNDEGFLAITSCELAVKEIEEASSLDNQTMRVCHLNIYTPDPHDTLTPCYSSVYDHFIKNDAVRAQVRFDGEYHRVYSGEGVRDIIARAHERGFLVSYNHPQWSLEDARQYLEYRTVDFVEVYNHGTARNGMDTYAPAMLDEFLREGADVRATMCDDAHSLANAFGGWCVINADALTYEAVFAALREKRFYASQGPEILELTREDDTVRIRTSPCRMIALSTGSRHYQAERGTAVTEAAFTLKPTDRYFRLTVTDEGGYHAMTQAYPV